jgi:hypothetical protein
MNDRFADMTVKELEEILRADCLEEGDLDAEELEQILSQIEKKDADYFAGLPDSHEAWKDFELRRLSRGKKILRLEQAVKKRSCLLRKWGHVAGFVFGVLTSIFLTCRMMSAQAESFEPTPKEAEWTDEAFWFNTLDPKAFNGGGDMTKEEVIEHFMPTWLPEGYEWGELEVYHDPNFTAYSMACWKGDELMHIVFHHSITPPAGNYEKDARPVKEFECGGVTYYIMYNLKHLTAAWTDEGFECMISGPITVDEMERIIQSIYEK